MYTPQWQESPGSYIIRDTQQMVWVLKENSLFAVPSSGNVQPVTVHTMPCTDTELNDGKEGNLIYMGVKGVDLCLSCLEVQGHPTLQLKEKNIMDLYKEKTAQKPFLFLHSPEGSTSSFQSVAYPGWFIATSSHGKEPVFLTQERGKTYITNFYFDPEEKILSWPW
ncbi:interleukin-36 beta-like [Saccopteryx leptura]|uniref:interleukin-36 beta-like n=1 Tax=Saccopteryx leptura TaxID=249018 RepID=UPI00339C8A01